MLTYKSAGGGIGEVVYGAKDVGLGVSMCVRAHAITDVLHITPSGTR